MVRINAPSVLTAWLMASGLAALVAQQSVARPQTPSLATLPALFFTEPWRPTGLEREVDNGVLSHPKLELRLYRSRQ